MCIADEAQMGYTLPLQGSLEEKIPEKWYPKQTWADPKHVVVLWNAIHQ